MGPMSTIHLGALGLCLASLTFASSPQKRFIYTNNNNNNNNNNNIVSSTVYTYSDHSCTTAYGDVYTLAKGYTTAGCTKCSCTASGMMCSSLACPSHTRDYTDSHKCLYNGVTYNFADTFKHTDGCNECVCALNAIQCTSVTCTATTQTADCTQDGKGYMSGDTFPHSDGCNQCQCTILGVMCTSNTCTTTTTTTTMEPYVCEWFGKFYHEGDAMQGDGCHTCLCQAGKAVCSATMNCPITA